MVRLVIITFGLLLVACANPTGPSSNVPQVAGNYSGTVTFLSPYSGDLYSCPVTASVTQSGFRVNLGTLMEGGSPPLCGWSIQIGQRIVDVTGAFSLDISVFTDPPDVCGPYTTASTAGFVGRELRISATATSSTPICSVTMTAVLSR
jgi:hypothetical protein